MRSTSFGNPDVRRVVAIAGATAVVMTALVLGNPFYSAVANTKAPSRADVSKPVAHQEPATETAFFTISPSDDANSEFFFGAGDGSNGYYAEQPEPPLALVRYAQMCGTT
jgi:hypothetical protein